MITNTTEDKKVIAKWISGCDDMIAEIEYLLDKAYPDGAEDRFYREWEGVLERRLNDWGLTDNQYV